MKTTKIDLLRHGVCEGGEIFRGSTDVPLLETGKKQMATALQQHCGWTKIVTSPLRRCLEFAQDFATQQQLPLLIDERWREIDFGIWDGQPISEIYSENRSQVEQYFSNPSSVTPTGGEPVTNAMSRVVAAFVDLLKQHQGEHTLVILHGGSIRFLLAHVLGLPIENINRLEVPYACLTRLCAYHSLDQEMKQNDSVMLVSHCPLESQ